MKDDTLAAYSDFKKWCKDNPHLNLDSRPHTHGGAIGDGGYISDEKTRIAFAAWRAAIKADRQRRSEPTAAEISDVIREITGCPDIKNGEDSLVVALGMLFHRCATTQSSEPDYKQLFEQMCERCDALDAKLAEYSEREPVAWQYFDGTYWTTTIDPDGHVRAGRKIRPLYAAAPAQEPTASEAVYAFSAWLTTRDQDVTIGSTQDAAPIANLVSLFVDSQGWDQPRSDYTDYLRAYPKEAPQPAEPVKVNAIFETEIGEIVGTTDAKVKRVEWQDDGSLTVVIDYWPHPAAPAQESSVPEGWRLVPAEPTESMIEGMRTGSRRDWPSDELCRVRYVAMLAAAPKFGEEE